MGPDSSGTFAAGRMFSRLYEAIMRKSERLGVPVTERKDVAMSATGLEVFDKSLQTTNIWLDEIMEELGPDRQVAWHALGAVLRVIRDRLPPELAAHLGAELPLIVRGTYFDQYRPEATPNKWRSADEFLQKIGDELKTGRPVGAEDALRVVARVLAHHLEDGQITKVWEALPNDVRRIVRSGLDA